MFPVHSIVFLSSITAICIIIRYCQHWPLTMIGTYYDWHPLSTRPRNLDVWMHACVCVKRQTRKMRFKKSVLNVPRDVRRQEMTCSTFKAPKHWWRRVCGQLYSAPGNQELFPTVLTTALSVRACCIHLASSLPSWRPLSKLYSRQWKIDKACNLC